MTIYGEVAKWYIVSTDTYKLFLSNKTHNFINGGSSPPLPTFLVLTILLYLLLYFDGIKISTNL